MNFLLVILMSENSGIVFCQLGHLENIIVKSTCQLINNVRTSKTKRGTESSTYLYSGPLRCFMSSARYHKLLILTYSDTEKVGSDDIQKEYFWRTVFRQ